MSIPYTTRPVAKSIAEDTVKERFAKPYNFGEFDAENTKFVLDKPIEEGKYFIELIATSDGEKICTYSLNMIIDNTSNSSQTATFVDQCDTIVFLVYDKYTGIILSSLEEISFNEYIIYLYKLD